MGLLLLAGWSGLFLDMLITLQVPVEDRRGKGLPDADGDAHEPGREGVVALAAGEHVEAGEEVEGGDVEDGEGEEAARGEDAEAEDDGPEAGQHPGLVAGELDDDVGGGRAGDEAGEELLDGHRG